MKQLPSILIAVATLLWASAAQAAKPNVLIIVADDLGYSDVGFNGSKVIRTPNLDRLAADGVVLSDFRVGSSRVDLQACKLEYSIVSPK